jgi:hypothetical protein
MDKPQSKLQSFIVKLWLEESGDETGKAIWRGHITHVPSGERRYLKRQSDIMQFIHQHLGVKSGLVSRFADWSAGRKWPGSHK